MHFRLCLQPCSCYFLQENASRIAQSGYKVYLRNKENTFAMSRVVTLTKKQEKILKAISPKLLAE